MRATILVSLRIEAAGFSSRRSAQYDKYGWRVVTWRGLPVGHRAGGNLRGLPGGLPAGGGVGVGGWGGGPRVPNKNYPHQDVQAF